MGWSFFSLALIKKPSPRTATLSQAFRVVSNMLGEGVDLVHVLPFLDIHSASACTRLLHAPLLLEALFSTHANRRLRWPIHYHPLQGCSEATFHSLTDVRDACSLSMPVDILVDLARNVLEELWRVATRSATCAASKRRLPVRAAVAHWMPSLSLPSLSSSALSTASPAFVL